MYILLEYLPLDLQQHLIIKAYQGKTAWSLVKSFASFLFIKKCRRKKVRESLFDIYNEDDDGEDKRRKEVREETIIYSRKKNGVNNVEFSILSSYRLFHSV